ncbi:MAG TPA: glutamate-1-semialdehyde 2,1-aminomutase [Thermoleophilia bacterium]|nr:glutamate-1-semialdehyde 2,1-aminomutase [Thermoleophilia bacterium]
MDTEASRRLYEEALRYIPGGVNSPVRAMKSVGMEYPLFIARGKGAHLWDADGNEFIDFVSSWGPMLVGYSHPAVAERLHAVLEDGTSFGAPTAPEVEMAKLVCEAVPSIEMVRMVNSGTEATMSAVRVARGFTGRAKVVKFIGCYHGHSDAFLAAAGSGVLPLSLPDSPGVTAGTTTDTILIEYNDVAALESLFAERGEEIACVVVEPVAGNMGVVPPRPGFLESLRRLCSDYGTVLIFDEVITGFRVAWGGAQQRYGVLPDMTCLGKIIGGGLPVGAFGGRREIMETVAPIGATYQAGTLSGNPLAMAAGAATLRLLREEGTYARLESIADRVASGLRDAVAQGSTPATLNQVGAMMTLFFCEGPVLDFATAKAADTAVYARYWRHMLERGVYLAPSQFESTMISLALTDDDLARAGEAAADFFRS